MAKFLAMRIKEGKLTLAEVPEKFKKQVEEFLKN